MTYSNMYVLTYALNKLKFKNNELMLKEKNIKRFSNNLLL